MKYVDGYVLPVPPRTCPPTGACGERARIWRDHGALDYMECLGTTSRRRSGHRFRS